MFGQQLAPRLGEVTITPVEAALVGFRHFCLTKKKNIFIYSYHGRPVLLISWWSCEVFVLLLTCWRATLSAGSLLLRRLVDEGGAASGMRLATLGAAFLLKLLVGYCLCAVAAELLRFTKIRRSPFPFVGGCCI
ncbi:hypothetical protein EUGRSUZ_H02282 [Eucalyptus grandis]|uniref:Uncharacterized protein n=2 Tax=Eucalyptus grandis TaxID=71139 RepID=A0ACC3JS35_EUCGR|nr:hypothetical protein EUGRSUZ_H02282 [Eucalyptus grandis]